MIICNNISPAAPLWNGEAFMEPPSAWTAYRPVWISADGGVGQSASASAYDNNGNLITSWTAGSTPQSAVVPVPSSGYANVVVQQKRGSGYKPTFSSDGLGYTGTSYSASATTFSGRLSPGNTNSAGVSCSASGTPYLLAMNSIQTEWSFPSAFNPAINGHLWDAYFMLPNYVSSSPEFGDNVYVKQVTDTAAWNPFFSSRQYGLNLHRFQYLMLSALISMRLVTGEGHTGNPNLDLYILQQNSGVTGSMYTAAIYTGIIDQASSFPGVQQTHELSGMANTASGASHGCSLRLVGLKNYESAWINFIQWGFSGRVK